MVTKKEDEKTINDVELDAILADDSKPITGAGASDGKGEKTAEQLAAEQKAQEDADKAAKDKEEASQASVRENAYVRFCAPKEIPDTDGALPEVTSAMIILLEPATVV